MSEAETRGAAHLPHCSQACLPLQGPALKLTALPRPERFVQLHTEDDSHVSVKALPKVVTRRSQHMDLRFEVHADARFFVRYFELQSSSSHVATQFMK